MRIRAESCRRDLAFLVALVFVVVNAQDRRDGLVSAQMQQGESIRLRPGTRREKRRRHICICSITQKLQKIKQPNTEADAEIFEAPTIRPS